MLKILGGFEIEERIGAGAMGTVYRAYQRSLSRHVVVKTLHPHLAEDSDLVARFEREARHAAGLQHPNTVQVIDYGHESGTFYIAMELVEGLDLKDLAQAQGQPTTPLALLILRDVSRGLEAAHEKDIIHRDIKPANLMVTTRGTVKVMDFGLARQTAEGSTITMQGSVMGSAAYMSPEQAQGKAVDHRSDIFSTGLVGYEMLCGQRAFPGDSYAVVLHDVIYNDPISLSEQNPDLDPEVVELIHQMIDKDLDRRCPDIGEARDRFESITEKMGLRRGDILLADFVREPWEASKKRRRPGPIVIGRGTTDTVREGEAARAGEDSGTPVADDSEFAAETEIADRSTLPEEDQAEERAEDVSAVRADVPEEATRLVDPAPATSVASQSVSPSPPPASSVSGRSKRSRLPILSGIAVVVISVLLVLWYISFDRDSSSSDLARDGGGGDNPNGEVADPADPINPGASNSGDDPNGGDQGAAPAHGGSQPILDAEPLTDRDIPVDGSEPSPDGSTPVDPAIETGPGPGDRPARDLPGERFEKRYRISTVPFASVYIDDDPTQWNQVGNFTVTLEQGIHRFHCTDEGGNFDTILWYEVPAGDPNNILIFDLFKNEVRPRVD